MSSSPADVSDVADTSDVSGVLDVLDDPAAAAAVLDPLRARILRALRQPGSATSVADLLGETRQKINYHLRTLDDLELIELVEERPRRGLTERIFRATARAYVVAPAAVGPLAAEPASMDRLSAQYLIAVAARLVDEVGALARGARQAGRPLPTLTIDTEIRLADAEARAAFTAELSAFVTDLAARYHDESAPNGRWHRLVAVAHPRPRTGTRTGPHPATPADHDPPDRHPSDQPTTEEHDR